MKKAILLLLALLMCVGLFFGCSSEKTYKTRILYNSDNITVLNEIEDAIISKNVKWKDDKVERVYDIKIYNDTYELDYVDTVETIYSVYNEYKSDDADIYAQVDSNGKILRLVFNDSKLGNVALIEEYESYIENFFEVFGEEDLSKYNYSCSTLIRIFGDDYEETKSINGFYTTLAADEAIGYYMFDYNVSINDLKTSDGVKIRIYPEDGRVIADFNHNDFANIDKDISVNKETLTKSIEEKIKSQIKTGINFKGMSITDYKLVSLRGEILCESVVSISYTINGYKDTLNDLIIVYTDLGI